MGSPGSTAPSRGGDEPSPLYVPFALARAEVAKALGYPEDAAAEWLRGEAVAGRVGVRYSERYVRLHPTNLRLAGNPANLTEAERTLPYPQPISPLDDLRLGPTAMAEHRIVRETEWDAGMLSLALAAETARRTALPSLDSPPAAPRRARGGRRPAEAWWRAMVEVGAWLRDHGEPETLAEVERYLAERLARHGSEDVAESVVRERARLALDTFTAWKAGN